MHPPQKLFDKAVRFIEANSAATIPHVGGTLLPHLSGTCDLLGQWGNDPAVCLAGLCHTAYGTDGFPTAFVDPARRDELAEVIGADAERIVYFYDACDREFFYPQIARQERVLRFRDRYTGEEFEPDEQTMRGFLELTFANELEIFRRCEMNEYQQRKWRAILSAARKQVSPAAARFFEETLPAPKWQLLQRVARKLKSATAHSACWTAPLVAGLPV